MQAQMLAPAAVLVCWSMIMLVWMVVVRIRGVMAANLNASESPRGSRGVDLEGRVPPPVMWPAHNYNHLMEQPTVFYAAVVILAIMGASSLDVILAWIYVGLRMAHSVWQAAINIVGVRATLWLLSSAVLMVIAVRALMATLGHA